jgi:hypothetical protein
MKRQQQTIPHHGMRTATAVHTPRMHSATAVRMPPKPTPPIQVYPIALEIVQTAIKSAKTDLILNQVMNIMKSEPDACSLRKIVPDVTVPMRLFEFIGTSKYNMEYPKFKKPPNVPFHPPKMKSTKKVHFSMNPHHQHHKKAEAKPSKLYPKHLPYQATLKLLLLYPIVSSRRVIMTHCFSIFLMTGPPHKLCTIHLYRIALFFKNSSSKINWPVTC